MSNQAKKLTIEQIQKQFFEIPPYQRLYEWGKEQIEMLLDDMKKAWKPDDCQSSKSNADSQKSSKQYFIGNITTSKKSENGQNIFVLIDGQQRLTTLWFIGFYLASREYEWKTKDENYKKVWQEFILQNDKLRIAMPIRDNEEKALKELARKIIELKSDKDKYKLADSLPSNIHKKIKKAFECIEIWFNNVENIQESEVKNFAEFIYTKVCFVFVELAQNTDLNRFFVRMNNRGKQLEKHEILKARILHKISETEREKYAEIWDLCSDMNKYIFQSKDSEIYEVESIIDFPTFLLHCYKLWLVNELLWREKGKYAENEILEILKKITITKDKLLEIMWENKNSDKKGILCDDFIFNSKNSEKAKQNCENFIKYILYYRVLFDGFVIKFTAKKGKETNKKESPYKIKRLGSDDNLVNSNLNDLEMIQNYLRVARQGDRINYHHWLTLFLIHLDSEKIGKEIWRIVKDNFEKIDEIAKLFKTDAEVEQDNNKKADTVDTKKLYNETNMITFLENLDTKLAIAQMPNQDNKDDKNKNLKMITIADEVLQNLDSVKDFEVNKEFHKNNKWDFLKYGNDIRYWFYRLEYYLWKNGVENEENLKIRGKSFDKIRKNFYFRNLGSVEHFQPQSEPDAKWWLNDKSEMDTFGNLALISRSLNSSLGKQNLDKKEIDIAKEGNSESLKLVLMCCLKNNNNAENGANSKAQTHQKQMLDILIKSLKSSQ